mmetsp:Transcript_23080/g.57792  ORF Transcript_23080/g.57792 Transcript_23080/m.57792 type:complete len:206 (+) Transcript_23080:445-1062(+)
MVAHALDKFRACELHRFQKARKFIGVRFLPRGIEVADPATKVGANAVLWCHLCRKLFDAIVNRIDLFNKGIVHLHIQAGQVRLVGNAGQCGDDAFPEVLVHQARRAQLDGVCRIKRLLKAALVVVVPMLGRVVDTAHVHKNIAGLPNDRIARAADISFLVFGEEPQHGARQRLIAMETSIVGADHGTNLLLLGIRERHGGNGSLE